ncbi:MAG: hypothetical protein R3C05_09665 [Pirellulaceae bacterium]
MTDRQAESANSAPPRNPWAMGGIAVLAIVALGMFAAIFTTFTSRTAGNVDATLRLAGEEYNQQHWDVVESLLQTLTPSPEWTEEQNQQYAFFKAASRVRQAFSDEDPQARRLKINQRLGELRQSATEGFPEAYIREAKLLMGEGEYATGDFASAAETFSDAIGGRIDDQRRYLRQLAESQLRSPRHSVGDALASIDRFLALPTIGVSETAEANLLRAMILGEKGSFEEALEAARLAGQDSEFELDSRLQQIKIELTRAGREIQSRQRSDSKPHRTAAITQTIETATEQLMELARKADDWSKLDVMLTAGQALRMLDENEKALGIFGPIRQNRIDAAASIVASIEELEILAATATGDECLATVAYLTREMGDPDGFDPRLISLDLFRSRLSGVVQKLQQRDEFEVAIDMARQLVPIFDESDALRMEADSYALWGDHVLQQNTRNDGSVDRPMIEQSKQLYAAAGDAFAQAAYLRLTSELYPQFLWDAIEQYEKAHQYQRCLDLLQPYLRYEQRDQAPRGLILQTKALMSLGDFKAAQRVCESCVAEFARDSLTYEARLLGAQSAIEMGDVDTAKNLLEANLHDGLLTPESSAWLDSLYALCELLYAQAVSNHYAYWTPGITQTAATAEKQNALYQQNQEIFEAAIRQLEEAIERLTARLKESPVRNPDVRAKRRMLYLAAQAHQYAAFWPKREAAMAETIDSSRRELQQQHVKHMKAAAKYFQELKNDLNQFSDNDKLSTAEQTMLRNCYLGEADALMELRNYDEAIATYRAAINRFINEPIALEALVQQARCFEMLGNDDDMQRVLKQAQQILDRIPTEFDDRFATTTRYNRAGWINFLQWMNST